jgi:hypothetical protein
MSTRRRIFLAANDANGCRRFVRRLFKCRPYDNADIKKGVRDVSPSLIFDLYLCALTFDV